MSPQVEMTIKPWGDGEWIAEIVRRDIEGITFSMWGNTPEGVEAAARELVQILGWVIVKTERKTLCPPLS